MPGALVNDQNSSFLSSVSSAMLENVSGSPRHSPELGKASAYRSLKLLTSHLDAGEFLSDVSIPSNFDSVDMAFVPASHFCNLLPLSSPDRRRDNFCSRMFSDQGRIGGDLVFGNEMSEVEGFGTVFSNNLNSVNMSSFPALNLYNIPPSSQHERGSPRFVNGNGGRDGSGSKSFSRSLSKLRGIGEDLILAGGEMFDMEGFGFENVGGASAYESLTSSLGSPVLSDAISALQKFLPSNHEELDGWPSVSVDAYSCDEFRMYEFKVRRCMRGKSHDWTECPFAHPGEKARRRDPRRFHYSGNACPDFKKGSCKRGDACEFAHGVFECWLHPARYRTQQCKDGRNCKRRVCFFAHVPEQLRVLPGSAANSPVASSASRSCLFSSPSKSSLSGSYDGSPLRQALAGSLDSSLCPENWPGLGILDGAAVDGFTGSPRKSYIGLVDGKKPGSSSCQNNSSPTSTLVGHVHSPPHLSPPLSPARSPPISPETLNGWSGPNSSHVSAFSTPASPMTTHGPSPLSSVIPGHRRHLDRLGSLPYISVPLFESEGPEELTATALKHLELSRVAEANRMSPRYSSSHKPVFHAPQSLPCTPTKSKWLGQIDPWATDCDSSVPLQRVESGRDLRAKIYGKLCRENLPESDVPDFGWVNELVK